MSRISRVGNYAEVHLHTHDSNTNMIEVVTKIEQYLERAKELDMKGIVVTNHGVTTNWYNNKKKIEGAGFKYVHGLEAYVTWSLDEKVRDNFHLSLYAKNTQGFKELNKMISKSFNREDGHFYYNPRMTWEEIKNTSDNIIISTACLGGLLSKLDGERYTEVVRFLAENNHRCFLEVQPHMNEDQKKLNANLSKLSRQIGVPLIAGGDVHALNQEHDNTRKILQKSKDVVFDNDSEFDLTLKGYGERFEMFELQGVLSEEEIQTALENTCVLIDMVEPIELDYSKKYPKVVEGDSLEVFKQKINEGIKYRNVMALPLDEKKVYAERIQHELETYIANEAIDYMLLEDLVKSYARSKGVDYGYGRGSASGSIIAYLMQITEMNSIERNLNFERFMSKERISLADIDSDYPPALRHIVQEFVINQIPNVYSAPIMTANTIAMKGAIKDIGRGLEMPLDTLEFISKTVEDNESELRKEYPLLFKHVDIAIGVITSIGQHACFDKDSLVVTDNGIKEIGDIQIGEKVLTHNNRYKPVMDIMVNDSNDIYELKVGSTNKTIVTGNHPMYIREVENHRTRKGGIDKTWRTWRSPQWVDVRDIKIGKHWIGTPINQENVIPSYEEYDKLPFDNKDFWWLIGRYLGDGWTEFYERDNGWNERRTIICCSQSNGEYKDIQNILTRLNSLEHTGIEFCNRMETSRTTYKFYIGAKSDLQLYNYLQTFGKYAHGKYLNSDVLNLPTSLLESFLDGYFSADGSHIKETRVYSFKTVSKKLAQGVSRCINKVYKRHCSMTVIPSKVELIEGRKVNSREKYNVTFTKDVRDKERSFYENGYIWTRVKSVNKQINVNKPMYNLTVLDDSSYNVNGLIAHNCGICISPIPLDENMGLITTSDSIYPLTMLNMKEIDAQNYVKLDLLGLDTVQIISEACKLAGIPYLTPNNMDINDEKVWYAIREDNTNIFQYESDFAKSILQDLFSNETIKKIRAVNPNFSYMDLFSLGNAILRPAGASYRNEVVMGNFYDNGHKALNEFLAPTLGRLVYQEQLIQFLVEFCGYTGGHADLIRRGIGKKSKEIMDEEIPKIKGEFVKTMVEKHGATQEEAERIADPFIQVFIDSANYGFSINHSDAYSFLGYACGYLRYYYPLEFLTACLNANKGKEEKINKLIEYAKTKGIEIKNINYGNSKAEYMFNKEENAIYQGIESIKYLNEQVGNGLYELSKEIKADSFIDLLVNIYDNNSHKALEFRYHETTMCKTCKKIEKEAKKQKKARCYCHTMTEEELHWKEKCPVCWEIDKEYYEKLICDDCIVDTKVTKGFDWTNVLQLLQDSDIQPTVLQHEKEKSLMFKEGRKVNINARQMKILIMLNFFSDYGNNKALLSIFEQFDKRYSSKHKLKTKIERYSELVTFEKTVLIENAKLSLSEQVEGEIEFLGHVVTKREDMQKNVYAVSSITIYNNNVRFMAYQFATGTVFEFKVKNNIYNTLKFDVADIVMIQDVDVKPKSVKVGSKWQPSPTEKTIWVKQMKTIKRRRG